ncbi:SGNH/GDSL hydrolase family protein [Roseibacillus ishigakijimensis]|uniref:SGNH/GDSL hydrolase family protein n=1 Tax=Roseibacillus ishigakijimensis TaxID=454146 RepID=A0A934RQ20_9BACT|nr:SGNH/GDSL hydrolase family protein [Roseibacillus ishigakijimensis]MBK1833004.1 hypothetical protein [Roseibacillus ishigakijimensis]
MWRALSLVLITSGLVSGGEILFIGNSFVHGHDARVQEHGGVPAIFETIAREEGQEVGATMRAVGGKDWRFHLESEETRLLIASRQWDWVVLQNYSTKPTRVGDREAFFREGKELAALIWKTSPQAGIVLYQTWARSPEHGFYRGLLPKFPSFAAMDRELVSGYRELADRLRAEFPGRRVRRAPVGSAFTKALSSLPAEALYDPDHYHASPAGSYLAALVTYGTIFEKEAEKPPRRFDAFEVSEPVARVLRESAAQSVLAMEAAAD